MIAFMLFILFSNARAGTNVSNSTPMSCECSNVHGLKNCGTDPAFMSQKDIEITRQLGFDVPSDHIRISKTLNKNELFKSFVGFLEKSDHSKMFYPEYYTRATKDASILTLKSKFVPKNTTETDEYFRCSIPRDKYCLYRKKLRPYIGLAAKASRIDFSFLACQSYVESRFQIGRAHV